MGITNRSINSDFIPQYDKSTSILQFSGEIILAITVWPQSGIEKLFS